VPARVCVLFDLPLDRLTFTDRVKVKLGRALFDRQLPAASICYVGPPAAGRHLARQRLHRPRADAGAATRRLRGLGRGIARPRRRLRRAAFAHEARAGCRRWQRSASRPTGDNTGGASLAYFGDLRLETR